MDRFPPRPPALSSSPSPSRKPEKALMAELPAVFFEADQAKGIIEAEIEAAPKPWNLQIMQNRVEHLTRVQEEVDARLAQQVFSHYEEFVRGVQQVHEIETELALVSSIVKNGRRKLKVLDDDVVKEALTIVNQQHRRQRIQGLLDILKEFQKLTSLEMLGQQFLFNGQFCKAIAVFMQVQIPLRSDPQYSRFPGLKGLNQRLQGHVNSLRIRLNECLRAIAMTSSIEKIDVDLYEEVLKAFCMLPQSESVGAELCRHLADCATQVMRQCVLSFITPTAADEPPLRPPSPSHTHAPSSLSRHTHLRDLCSRIPSDRLVTCLAHMLEYLCDILYRLQYIAMWHVSRQQEGKSTISTSGGGDGRRESEGVVPTVRSVLAVMEGRRGSSCGGEDDLANSFEDILNFPLPYQPEEDVYAEFVAKVHKELLAGKKGVWERIQQNVMTAMQNVNTNAINFKEDSFFQVLLLAHLFIEEADAFMADCPLQAPRSRSHHPSPAPSPIHHTRDGSPSPSPSPSPPPLPWTHNLRQCMLAKGMEYFASLAGEESRNLKIMIQNDTWQRLPIPRNFRLIDLKRVHQMLPQGLRGWALSTPLFDPYATQLPAASPDGSPTAAGSPATTGRSRVRPAPNVRLADSNPFRNWNPDKMPDNRFGGRFAGSETDSDVSRHHPSAAPDTDRDLDLYRHWIDGGHETPWQDWSELPLERSNLGPVLSTSSQFLGQSVEKYLAIMICFPSLAPEICHNITLVMDIFFYNVLALCVHGREFEQLLESPMPPEDCVGGPRLHDKHDILLLQRQFGRLKDHLLGVRAFVARNPSHAATGALAELLPPLTNETLTSHTTLYGLAERVVGVESAATFLSALFDIRHKPPLSNVGLYFVGADMSHVAHASSMRAAAAAAAGGGAGGGGGGPVYLSEVHRQTQEAFTRAFQERTRVLNELRGFVYTRAASDLLQLETFIAGMSSAKWDQKDFPRGSPAKSTIDQLKIQLHDLEGRIEVAGGGCVPKSVQTKIWWHIAQTVVKGCVDVVARIRRFGGEVMPGPALFQLVEDFMAIQADLEKHLTNVHRQATHTSSGGGGVGVGMGGFGSTSPVDGRVAMPAKDFLDTYIKAHELQGDELLTFCKRHQEYSVRLHVALISKVENQRKAQKSCIADIEMYYAAVLHTIVTQANLNRSGSTNDTHAPPRPPRSRTPPLRSSSGDPGASHSSPPPMPTMPRHHAASPPAAYARPLANGPAGVRPPPPPPPPPPPAAASAGVQRDGVSVPDGRRGDVGRPPEHG